MNSNTDGNEPSCEVRRYLHEQIRVNAEQVTHYAHGASTPTFSIEQYVNEGILPSEYTASSDPHRMVKAIIKPEMIGILVAGDPGRNQSRAYLCNHIQGAPVSKAVRLPSNWRQWRERQ